jgi:hypothetical protein
MGIVFGMPYLMDNSMSTTLSFSLLHFLFILGFAANDVPIISGSRTPRRV